MKKVIGQIITREITHNGELKEAYIPQITIGNGWVDVMENNCYILKTSHNPILGCPDCGGHGCAKCNNRGTIKGKEIDCYHYAKSILDREIDKIENSLIILEKYERP